MLACPPVAVVYVVLTEALLTTAYERACQPRLTSPKHHASTHIAQLEWGDVVAFD
jgi:hypothetical protein